MKKIKKIYLLLSVLFATINLNAQIVYIPDTNFKNALLEGQAGINTNGDNEIQISEAIAFTGTIDCSSRNILDLTGIEAFVNLKVLRCVGNLLTSLDLSKNVKLEMLYCHLNQLTNLDLSKNIELVEVVCYNNQLQNIDVRNCLKLMSLGCFGNKLTSLDVSKNVYLKRLSCDSNDLTSLDVTKNLQLETLECFLNKITSLDLSKNTSLKKVLCFGNRLNLLNLKNGQNIFIENFDGTYNTNLLCIQVDEASYSTNNPNWYKDSFANYNQNCNYMAMNELEGNATILFPNPTKEILNINTKNFQKAEIISINCQLLKTFNSTTLNVSSLQKGIYIIKIYSLEKITIRKFVKD